MQVAKLYVASALTALTLFTYQVDARPVATNSGVANNMEQSLTPVQKDRLLWMREEEKLARDVYRDLYNYWQAPVFNQIAQAEQRHMQQTINLLQRYAIADPLTDDSVGVFTQTALSNLYSRLTAQGKQSLNDAWRVGAYIEELDIKDLKETLATTQQPDLTMVYNQLWRGSRNHLRAFASQLTVNGANYPAQVLNQAEVNDILSSSIEPGMHNRGKGRQGW